MPQSLGPLDLSRDEVQNDPVVIKAQTKKELIKRINKDEIKRASTTKLIFLLIKRSFRLLGVFPLVTKKVLGIQLYEKLRRWGPNKKIFKN